MEKLPPLGAALAETGVSSYWELVLCDAQRVSRFPASTGVMWKEPLLLQNKSLNFPWQLTQ